MVQSVKAFPHESMRTWVGSPSLKTNNKNESDWWPELIISRQKAKGRGSLQLTGHQVWLIQWALTWVRHPASKGKVSYWGRPDTDLLLPNAQHPHSLHMYVCTHTKLFNIMPEGLMAQLIKCLPYNYESLGSIPGSHLEKARYGVALPPLFFEGGRQGLCVTLTVLELKVYTRVAWNSERSAYLLSAGIRDVLHHAWLSCL